MNCREAEPLVEKLADGEATPDEMLEAEAHLKECGSCRAQLELLRAVERASSGPLPEPPSGYFESLPERVLVRLDAETAARKGYLSPSLLRWGALAACLVIAAAIGIVVQRDGLLEERQSSTAESVPPSSPPAAPSQDAGAIEPLPEEAPPLAPSRSGEAPSAAVPDERPDADVAELPAARDQRRETTRAATVEEEQAAAPELAGERLDEAEGHRRAPETSQSMGRAEVEVARSRAASSLRRASPGFDCDALRRSLLDTVPASDEGRDLRYRLARCSLDRYRDDPQEELREVAIADAEAFLEIEGEGARAESIREELARLRE